MKEKYITFDDYYNVIDYLGFLAASKNNKVKYNEYVSMKPPHQRYIKIAEEDLPKFINYEIASPQLIRWLISVVKPSTPREEYLLLRIEGKDKEYNRYVSPKPLLKATKQDYIMVFKSFNFTKVAKISEALGKDRIYKWGTADIKGYDIYYCFNPYIAGLINIDDVLMEYGDNPTMGLKKGKVPNIVGELEYNLNHYCLVKEKLENKHYEAEFWYNGKIHPLKRESFL